MHRRKRKKSPDAIGNLETAGAATRSRKRRRTSTSRVPVSRRSGTPPEGRGPAEVLKMRKPRPLEPHSIEEHRVYIESELSRLTPEASRRGHGVDKFLRYLEDLSGIVESWDEKFDSLPSKIRESTESRGDMLWAGEGIQGTTVFRTVTHETICHAQEH